MQRKQIGFIILSLLTMGILVMPNIFVTAKDPLISALIYKQPQNTFIDPLVPVLWKQLSLPSSIYVHVHDIAINPTNSANIYIATDNTSIPVIYSNDFGTSWITNTVGLPLSSNGDRVAIDPISPNYIYAGLRISEGIYRSDDSGQTWTEKNEGISPVPIGFSALVVHPITSTLVMAGSAVGTPYIYRSEDRGDTWVTIPLTGPNNRIVTQILVDNHNPSKIYAVVKDEGVFISENAGLTWANSGIIANSFAVDPINSNIYYRLQCQLYKSEDGGSTWDQLQTPEPCYDSVYIDQFDNSTLYLTSQYRSVTRSVDSGESWMKLDRAVDGSQVTTSWTFEIDPIDNTRQYVQGNSLYVSLYLDETVFLPFVVR